MTMFTRRISNVHLAHGTLTSIDLGTVQDSRHDSSVCRDGRDEVDCGPFDFLGAYPTRLI